MRCVIDRSGLVAEIDAGNRACVADTNFNAIEAFVKAQGCIWVAYRGTHCDIRLQDDLSAEAEAALYLLLAHQFRHTRIRISFVQGDVSHGIYPSAAAAIEAIGSKLWSRRQAKQAQFSSRPMGERDRGKLDIEPFRVLVAAQQTREGIGSLRRFERLLKSDLRGRFLVVEKPNSGPEPFVIRSLGPGYKTLDTSWTGKALDQHPDIDYGAWLARTYLSAMKSPGPLLQDVDTVVYKPKVGRRRYSYRRLLLPYEYRGRRFLLSASIDDPAVDLGLQ